MTAALKMTRARRIDHAADQISGLADTYRSTRAVGDLVRLRDARIIGGRNVTPKTHTAWADRRKAAPPPDLFAIAPGTLPEVSRQDLSVQTVSSAMHHYGALIVRNFFSPRDAFEFRHDIDNVLAAAASFDRAQDENGIDQLEARIKAHYLPPAEDVIPNDGRSKAFLTMSGACGTFLSPRVSHKLLDQFEQLGLRSLLQGYFQDEACLSFYKSVLRRAEPLAHPAEWHQDGAFMTPGIDSLNLWVALSECGAGTNRPGMDLLPKRLTKIVKPGTNGAAFEWSVSGKSVAEHFPDTPIAQPWFGEGDAVFFDHMNLHATSSGPEFTAPRYAIETWFFPKSRCAVNQQPVFW